MNRRSFLKGLIIAPIGLQGLKIPWLHKQSENKDKADKIPEAITNTYKPGDRIRVSMKLGSYSWISGFAIITTVWYMQGETTCDFIGDGALMAADRKPKDSIECHEIKSYNEIHDEFYDTFGLKSFQGSFRV